MRLVLLHYHILKNGGSTIEEILRRSFGERFLSFDLPDRDAEIAPAQIVAHLERSPRAVAFSSHQIFYPVPRVPGFLFFDLCFLRDPIDRIRSIYDYFRGKSADDDPIRQLAHDHTLADFTRRLIEEMPWTVNDVQVNLLANGLVNDQPRGVEDLEIARRRMLETSFLGVVDLFDESLVAGQYRLNAVFPDLDCAQEAVNDSAQPGSTLADRTEQFRRACGDELFSDLVQLNQMDFELLDRARAEIRRRFDLVPDREDRLRALRARGKISAPRKTRRVAEPVKAANPSALAKLTRAIRFAADFRRARHFKKIFDADYYREMYPAIKNPLWHYVTQGAFEGRNPHPLFDTDFYLRQCPRAPRINALSDYLKHGGQPHPLFDPEFYARRYPDIAKSGIDPLLHYLLHGAAEGRKPNPLFQPEFYLAACPEARHATNPLAHFAESEPCSNPHPLFDCESYLRAHPEVKGNPLADYRTRTRIETPARTILIDDVPLAMDQPAPGQRRFLDAARPDQITAQLPS